MSIDYCDNCKVIVEGAAETCKCCGKDHICPYCYEPVSGFDEDDPTEDR